MPIVRASMPFVLALALLPGCARQQKAALADPITEELPVFPPDPNAYPVTVAVEGRGDTPRMLLVPTFEPPEYTPEERAALGLDREPAFDWLEFYEPPRAVPLGGYGGATVGAGGLGGVSVGLEGARSPFLFSGERAGIEPGITPVREATFGVGDARSPIFGVGPRSEVNLGYGYPKRISGQQARVEP